MLDGGVSVGDGPVAIDESAQTITASSPVPVGLLRSGSPLSLGTSNFVIDAHATTDPTSGHAGLARVTLTTADLAGLEALGAGGLPLSFPDGDGVTVYLDSQNGGGILGSGTLSLPLLGQLSTSAAVSLGFYAGTAKPVTVQGGAVHFGAVTFGQGWGFNGLDLAYQAATDTWTASGGLTVPIASLQASGSVVGGKLDSVNFSIGDQNIPLGDSGFFFTTFGGGVSGLASGPLSLSASTAGFWGVPKLPVEPFYLDNVTFTLNLAGSASLDGSVSFALKDHSPVTGHLKLALGISPFTANGSVTVDAKLPTVSMDLDGGAGFTPHHFTVSGKGTLKYALMDGTGQEVVSDAGLGATGTVCSKHVGSVHFCQTLGFTVHWSQIQQLLHLDLHGLNVLGGDPASLITVKHAASGPRGIAVSAGRRMLLIDVHAPPQADGTPAAPSRVHVQAPSGAIYAHTRGSVLFGDDPQYGLTQITIVRPAAGTWRVSGTGNAGPPLSVYALTTHSIAPLHPHHPKPASSARHRLAAKRHVTLTWTSRGLQGAHVKIIDRATRARTGKERVLIARAPASGHVAVRVGAMRRGANYLTLIASLNGVPFQEISVPDPVWRR